MTSITLHIRFCCQGCQFLHSCYPCKHTETGNHQLHSKYFLETETMWDYDYFFFFCYLIDGHLNLSISIMLYLYSGWCQILCFCFKCIHWKVSRTSFIDFWMTLNCWCDIICKWQKWYIKFGKPKYVIWWLKWLRICP